MLVDTYVILKLSFDLCDKYASFLLCSYLNARQYAVNSITKQIPFLTDFLVWHKTNNLSKITQESVDSYISELYSTKTKSYADVIRSYLKSFCEFLFSKEIIEKISFSTKPRGKEEDPSKLHKVFNYYKYLGLSKTADLSDIKKAYHKKARLLHPDVNQNDPNATNRIMSLNKIYDILKEESDRLAYDITMGFLECDDEYIDSLEGITWHDKSFYFIWI